MQEEKQMLNVKEVSQILGVSESTVRNLIRRQEFPSYKIGGSVRIKRDDVEAYIETRKQV